MCLNERCIVRRKTVETTGLGESSLTAAFHWCLFCYYRHLLRAPWGHICLSSWNLLTKTKGHISIDLKINCLLFPMDLPMSRSHAYSVLPSVFVYKLHTGWGLRSCAFLDMPAICLAHCENKIQTNRMNDWTIDFFFFAID